MGRPWRVCSLSCGFQHPPRQPHVFVSQHGTRGRLVAVCRLCLRRAPPAASWKWRESFVCPCGEVEPGDRPGNGASQRCAAAGMEGVASRRWTPSLCLLPALQPKEIKEIRDFLTTARRKDAASVKVMTLKNATKFKIRCSRVRGPCQRPWRHCTACPSPADIA